MISPGPAKGVAGLPDNGLAINANPPARQKLLRGLDVLNNMQSINEQKLRLELPDESNQFLAAPDVFSFAFKFP